MICNQLAFTQKDSSNQAQSDTVNLSNWRTKVFVANQDTFQLDQLSIFPNSVRLSHLFNAKLNTDSLYQIIDNQIILAKALQKDSLKITYRVFPYDLHPPLVRKDRKMMGERIDEEQLIGRSYTYSIYENNLEALNFNQMNLSGTFARGISLGNKQDLVLNSSLNLQVSGRVGDAEILGSITDNQLPLQPQGNTQQIQDFDQMFIQFTLNPLQLIAGDYDLKRPKNSYFMNYYRRLQGAQLSANTSLFNGIKTTVDGSFAFSRGKFARDTFNGIEGNQGPYRLKGNNGERFVVVLAGTERVFIDGQLMKRGANYDYIIDYNQGELTFTNKQLITKDKRIVLEFTYTDLNYLRTVYSVNAEVEANEKAKFHFNLFAEQDAKNQPAEENLSNAAKAVLLSVGDNIDRAFVSGASIPEESTGQVAYRMIDTLKDGLLYDSIFVYDNTEAGIYNVRFSEIATGGNYKRTLEATNGVVYEWVAPDSRTGLPQGTHEPIVLLITPKKKQLITLGADYNWSKNAGIQADLAISNQDLNTYSKTGNEDNTGWATRLTYTQDIKLKRQLANLTRSQPLLQLKGHYEFLNKNFEAVDPYRSREFQRDWNQNSSQKQAEHFFRASASWYDKKWGRVNYRFSGLIRDTSYQGLRHEVQTQLNCKGLELDAFGSYLQTATHTEKTQFWRPKVNIAYRFEPLGNLKIGIYGEQEWNKRVNVEMDSLSASSFYYNVIKTYVQLPVEQGLGLEASFTRRYDYAPTGTKFTNNTLADAFALSGQWTPEPKQKANNREFDKKQKRRLIAQSSLDWDFNYRNLRVLDTALSNQDPKETYLGRLSYRLNLMRNLVNWTTTYTLGAGQQQKIEYNYVEVDAGQGIYQWIDRNDDGIQQQNEFEQTNFQDQANFIRATVLTGLFVPSNNVGFNQNLNIHGRALAQFLKKRGKKQKGLDFLSRISTQSIFQIERKTLANADVLVFNPFQLNVADTALVSVQSRVQNTLFFNRSKPKFSLKFNQLDQRNKTLLAGGFDARHLREYTLLQGASLGRRLRLQNLLAYGRRDNRSEFFPDRDYQIQYGKIEPELNLTTAKNKFRVTLVYAFKHKKNLLSAQELALSHQLTARFKYTPKKTNLEASFSFVQLKFDGQPNTAVEFIMTEGLKDGKNYLWSLNFNRALSKDGKIQMWLTYEGRKVGNNSVVHVGRAQLRASF